MSSPIYVGLILAGISFIISAFSPPITFKRLLFGFGASLVAAFVGLMIPMIPAFTADSADEGFAIFLWTAVLVVLAALCSGYYVGYRIAGHGREEGA